MSEKRKKFKQLDCSFSTHANGKRAYVLYDENPGMYFIENRRKTPVLQPGGIRLNQQRQRGAIA
jgi:hypothetical protein